MNSSASIIVDDDLSMDRLFYFYSEDNAHQPDVVAFWESKLQHDCLLRRSLLLSVDECLPRFVVKDIYPSSLRPVLEVLLNRNQSLLTRKELLDGSIVDNDSSEIVLKFKLTWQLIQASYFSSGRQLLSTPDYTPVQLLRRCRDCILQYLSTVSESRRVVFRTPSSSVAVQFTFEGLLRKVARHINAAAAGAKSHMAELFESIAADSSQSTLLMAYLVGNRQAVLSSDGSIAKITANWGTSTNDPPSLQSIWFQGSVHERVGKLSEVDESSLRISCSIDHIQRVRDRVDVAISSHLFQARRSKVTYCDSFIL